MKKKVIVSLVIIIILVSSGFSNNIKSPFNIIEIIHNDTNFVNFMVNLTLSGIFYDYNTTGKYGDLFREYRDIMHTERKIYGYVCYHRDFKNEYIFDKNYYLKPTKINLVFNASKILDDYLYGNLLIKFQNDSIVNKLDGSYTVIIFTENSAWYFIIYTMFEHNYHILSFANITNLAHSVINNLENK